MLDCGSRDWLRKALKLAGEPFEAAGADADFLFEFPDPAATGAAASPWLSKACCLGSGFAPFIRWV